jgi:dephospho-CoA kinase
MAKSKKLLVAITGGIGSGKSTFAEYLAEQGYIVLSADDISKEILAKDPEVKKEITKEFGEESYSGKKVNKEFLANEVFSDPARLKKINSILHPRVREKINSISDEYFKTKDIVFVEAALIFESKMEKMYDYVVLIVADKDLRKKRVTSEGKISEKDFINRNEKQLDDEIKMNKADFVFMNNSFKAELKQKAALLPILLKTN